MRKIGVDIRLTYYRQGGIAEYMRQLTQALADLHPPYNFRLLHNFRANETITPQFKRENLFTPCHHRIENIALGVELLPRRLDLLHSPDFIPPRFGAKHYVITIHDLAFLLYANIQTADSLRYYAGQIERAVKQADQIIAVSQTTKDDIVHLLDVPEEKITVVYEGVHSIFKPENQEGRVTGATKRLPSKKSNLHSPLTPAPTALADEYILFVGTIEPRKNIPNLLRGYAILKAREKHIPKLVLVGQKGWLAEPSFEAIENLKLENDVMWLGNVPFDGLPELYRGAKMLVFPSLYEGFGFPPLEAMACGTPVVTSDRGSLKEITGDAAVYIDPDNPDSIADGMQKLLLDKALYQDLCDKGLKHVQQFTWESAAHQTLAVYQKVLA